MKHRVRAILIKENEVLLIKRVKSDTIYYVFPGGGVEKSEELEEAMIRECKEELGVTIEIRGLFTSERFDKDDLKQLEHFYLCDIVSGKLGTGDGPEYDVNSDYEGVHEIEWVNLDTLTSIDLRPNIVRDKLIVWLKK